MSSNQIEELKKRVFGKQKKVDNEEVLIMLHHSFMRAYGWIPLEEFRNLPIATFLDLIECMQKEEEEVNKKWKNK